MKKIIKITVIVLAIIYLVIAPITIAVIHGMVMSKCLNSTDTEVADAFDGAVIKVKDGANVYTVTVKG